MKKWYVTYTILTMVEGEDCEEAKAAAEKFAEDEDFYHLVNDMEVEEVEDWFMKDRLLWIFVVLLIW